MTVRFLLLLLVLSGTLQTIAQVPANNAKTITGKVTDAENAPLEGVNVILKGKTKQR